VLSSRGEFYSPSPVGVEYGKIYVVSLMANVVNCEAIGSDDGPQARHRRGNNASG
jgi:hypothetical protein